MVIIKAIDKLVIVAFSIYLVFELLLLTGLKRSSAAFSSDDRTLMIIRFNFIMKCRYWFSVHKL